MHAPGLDLFEDAVDEDSAASILDLVDAHNNAADANKFMASLKLCTPARSLGGCHTTVCLPAETSHARLTEAERREVGIGPGLVRFSVGIEDPDDIVADMEQALEKV